MSSDVNFVKIEIIAGMRCKFLILLSCKLILNWHSSERDGYVQEQASGHDRGRRSFERGLF